MQKNRTTKPFSVTLSGEDIEKMDYLLDYYKGIIPIAPSALLRHLIRKEYDNLNK